MLPTTQTNLPAVDPSSVPLAEPEEAFAWDQLPVVDNPYATPEFRDRLVRHFTAARNKAIAANRAPQP